MAKKKRQAKRHHTVPKFYLKRFSDDRELLTRIELPGIRRTISAKDATVHSDFYTAEAEDGMPSGEFETWLGAIESLAAPAFEHVIDGGRWPPTPEDRWAIAAWAALQYLRTPAMRRALDEMADQILKLHIATGGKPALRRILADMHGELPADSDVEEWWRDLAAFDDYEVKQHANNHLQMILDQLPGFTRTFVARGWWLVRFSRRTLLTSDSPVVLVASEDQPAWIGVGLLTAETIVVPLDRYALLMMRNIGDDDLVWPGSTRLWRHTVPLIATSAQRYVFHHPEDAALLEGLDLPEPRPREMSEVDLERFTMPDGFPSSAQTDEE